MMRIKYLDFSKLPAYFARNVILPESDLVSIKSRCVLGYLTVP